MNAFRSGMIDNKSNKKKTLLYLTGALGSSLLAYLCYHYTTDRSSLNQFYQTPLFYSVDDLIQSFQQENNNNDNKNEFRFKLYSSIGVDDDADDEVDSVLRVKVKPFQLPSTSSAEEALDIDDEDDEEFYKSLLSGSLESEDDDNQLQQVREAVLYNLHGEKVTFVSSSASTSIDRTTEASKDTTRESQKEQYEYIVHSPSIVLRDIKKSNTTTTTTTTNGVVGQSKSVIHIPDPINLLFNKQLELTVIGDDTLNVDPRYTRKTILKNHLSYNTCSNDVENKKIILPIVHTLTEIHDGDELDEEEEEEDVDQQGGDQQEKEEVNTLEKAEQQQETTAFYNILRQILPLNTRVFLYGAMRYNNERMRYELSKIFEFSNVVDERGIIQQMSSEHLGTNLGTFVLGASAVVSGSLAIKSWIDGRTN